MPTDPNHSYNVPSQGATDWHTPLNQNFNNLAVDVELRGSGAPSTVLGNSGVNGQKYLDTSTGEVYLSDGNSWTKEFEQLQSAGRYISTNSGTFNFSGPAEWQNAGATATNSASGLDAAVTGGYNNTASGQETTISGGGSHIADTLGATIGGGYSNTASGSDSVVAGGNNNLASGAQSAVPGGLNNVAGGVTSLAAGSDAEATNDGSFVWADDASGTISDTGTNQFIVEASGGMGVGTTSPTEQLDVAGNINSSGDIFATIVEASNLMRTGGMVLTGPINANPTFQVYTDGSLNMFLEGQTANDEAGNILFGAIPNISNTTADYGATISGGGLGGGAGEANEVYDNFGTIGGGKNNTAGTSDGTPTNAEFATVSGGRNNDASGTESTIGGGLGHTASGDWSTVAGGDQNEATADWSTVGGGDTNKASAAEATVAGGFNNEASGFESTVGGGQGNLASGDAATIPGGFGNTASGQHSFAAGRLADAVNNGSFVFGDSTNTTITSANDNEARFQMPVYAPSFNTTSARAAKTNVEPFEPEAALDGVASMDVKSWEFRETGDNGRHIGPMAEDFDEAFEVGSGDTIASVDADGVLFAAVQALSTKFEETQEEIEQKDERIDELEARLAALEEEIE